MKEILRGELIEEHHTCKCDQELTKQQKYICISIFWNRMEWNDDEVIYIYKRGKRERARTCSQGESGNG